MLDRRKLDFLARFSAHAKGPPLRRQAKFARHVLRQSRQPRKRFSLLRQHDRDVGQNVCSHHSAARVSRLITMSSSASTSSTARSRLSKALAICTRCGAPTSQSRTSAGIPGRSVAIARRIAAAVSREPTAKPSASRSRSSALPASIRITRDVRTSFRTCRIACDDSQRSRHSYAVNHLLTTDSAWYVESLPPWEKSIRMIAWVSAATCSTTASRTFGDSGLPVTRNARTTSSLISFPASPTRLSASARAPFNALSTRVRRRPMLSPGFFVLNSTFSKAPAGHKPPRQCPAVQTHPWTLGSHHPRPPCGQPSLDTLGPNGFPRLFTHGGGRENVREPTGRHVSP